MTVYLILRITVFIYPIMTKEIVIMIISEMNVIHVQMILIMILTEMMSAEI